MLAGLTLERDEARARKGERQRGKGGRVSKTGVNLGDYETRDDALSLTATY